MAATEAYSGICDMKILGASASSLDELSSLKYFNRFLRIRTNVEIKNDE